MDRKRAIYIYERKRGRNLNGKKERERDSIGEQKEKKHRENRVKNSSISNIYRDVVHENP